jgi:RNA polymerase sigma-70 factor (ECF subfamily)
MTAREFPACASEAVRPVDAMPSHREERDETNLDATRRLRGIFDRHYDFVWRTVRYFGVPESDADDAAQRVMCILARRLDGVAPKAELSFLFSTAARVASEARRAARRRPAVTECDLDSFTAVMPTAEELLDQRRAREMLRVVLDAMPIDLRVVFVLSEIEELTDPEVAALIGVRVGTAASRLRRAREMFPIIVRRMQAAQRHPAHGGHR